MNYQDDINILARTIYGEARGEYYRPDGGLASLIAVGNVVCNRFYAKGRYGKSISEICLRRYQFSCWNSQDPNSFLVKSVNQSDDLFKISCEVARGVWEQNWPDLTKGANHYHATWLNDYPGWAIGKKPTCRIGQHIFYKIT